MVGGGGEVGASGTRDWEFDVDSIHMHIGFLVRRRKSGRFVMASSCCDSF